MDTNMQIEQNERLITEEEIKAIVDDVSDKLQQKGALHLEILPVGAMTTVADYFIVCSGTSNTHIRALTQELEKVMETKYNLRPHHIEGYETAQWVLADYSFMVVHIFKQDMREFYSMERLWK